MTILLNNHLSNDELARDFETNGIVRLFDFLQPESANELSRFLHSDINYDNAFYLEGSNRQASDEDIAKLPPQTRQQLYRDIYKIAAKGQGFLYGRHKVENDSAALLVEALNAMNSQSTLDVIKNITKNEKITHADGQATRYRVGDFLTRHLDDIPGETRQIAYVLGMSENWHPDWGGLLQFFEADGTTTNSWSPVYNSLTLFDVSKIHSVTSIAPFAEKSRYSITGWYRI